MNDDYFKIQAERVRTIAATADPFTKKRLIALAESYDSRIGRPSRAVRALPSVEFDEKETAPGRG